MKDRLVVKNGSLILENKILESGYLIISGKTITHIGMGEAPIKEGDEVIDAKGRYISPGFIDLHIHGGGGHDFMDGTTEAYLGAAECHAKYGTTAMTPTTMTSSNEELFASFEAYREANTKNVKGAKFLGIHLEGPYFPYNRRGAQDPQFLKVPTPDDYNAILEASSDIVRWSIAPEVEGALELADVLVEKGIIASVAHTDAITVEMERAQKHGFSLMTHFYNAMSSITRHGMHKEGGAVQAAFLMDDMAVEMITDGLHVAESQMRMVFKSKRIDQIALITDAMRGAGMPNGVYKLGSLEHGQDVLVEDGIAKLTDGSALAGSVATANLLIAVVRDRCGVALEDAVRMLSLTPAKLLKLDKEKGSLSVGKDADITIFDEDINVYHTIVEGQEVFARN